MKQYQNIFVQQDKLQSGAEWDGIIGVHSIEDAVSQAAEIARSDMQMTYLCTWSFEGDVCEKLDLSRDIEIELCEMAFDNDDSGVCICGAHKVCKPEPSVGEFFSRLELL